MKSVLIMIDGEGDLGDPDEAKRQEAVDNHKPWVEAAKFLGCHSIRVNARLVAAPSKNSRSSPPTGSRKLCASSPSHST